MRNIFLFIAVVTLLASCAPREKLIAHGWQFKDVHIEPDKDSTTQALQQKMEAQMVTNLLISMGSDSGYTIRQLKEGNAIRGKWWFSADKKELYTKTDLGLNTYKIDKLTKKVLVYETVDPTSHKKAKIICVPKD